MKQQGLILGAEDSNLTRVLSSLRAWGDWGEENTRYLEASKEKKAFLWPSYLKRKYYADMHMSNLLIQL